jgi:hypothetical protein
MLNDITKIVFSRTLNRAEWNNSRLIKENMAEEGLEAERAAQQGHGDTWQWQHRIGSHAAWPDRRV